VCMVCGVCVGKCESMFVLVDIITPSTSCMYAIQSISVSAHFFFFGFESTANRAARNSERVRETDRAQNKHQIEAGKYRVAKTHRMP